MCVGDFWWDVCTSSLVQGKKKTRKRLKDNAKASVCLDSFQLKKAVERLFGNWGTLRIPREDWGTLGNIREY